MNRVSRAALFIVFVSLTLTAQKNHPDLILLNGKVFTADSGKAFAQAIAILGDRILAVGTSVELEKLAGPTTRRINLQGRLVVPGFNDAHFHFMPDPKGIHLQFRTMEPTWEETRAAIAQAAKQTAPGTWIFGSVGHDVVLNRAVTRFELDRIAPQHPVLLRAYYGHGYILNSRAMPLLHIAEEEPDPVGGHYERVAPRSRRINGRLWEYAEWKPNRVLASQVTDEEAISALRALASEAVKYGITSMQIFPSMPVDRFARLLVKADLPVRIRAIAFPATTSEGRDSSEIEQLPKLKIAGSKVTASGIKWILDGTPIEAGAALLRPYQDRPLWYGKLNFSEAEIVDMIRQSLKFDQPLLLHCVGDRTVEAVLKALDSFGTQVDWRTKRVRIEHGDGVIGGFIPRVRNLGVIVVQNPSHFSHPELMRRRWGPKMMPLKSLIEAGVALALGSDGPLNPFLNIMFATTDPYRPDEAISREQAVRAYTYVSAFAEFAEHEKGTITSGKLADLAVLSDDIFTTDAQQLPMITSVLTLTGGKIAYDAGALQTNRPAVNTP